MENKLQKIKKLQRQKYKIVLLYKDKCKKCGYDKCKEALDLHHINPKTKDITPANLRSYSIKRIKAELQKCIVLCANCHRELHHSI